MKKFILLLMVMIPLLSMSQAHLGSTKEEIKSFYSDVTFDEDISDNDIEYIVAQFYLGTWLYYFDDNGLCYLCIQVVDVMNNLNSQINIYNNKYVTLSDSKWKAYLAGGIINISLYYNDDPSYYYFEYIN